MEETLQHDETAFSTGIQAAGTGGHHPNRPKAGHALTFILDQSAGAGQINLAEDAKVRDALPADSE
jgi:archaellin